MGIFKATTGQVGSKLAVFLDYQLNQYDKRSVAVWLIVHNTINGFERLPFSYQYIEETSVRPYPVIRIVAGPGVSIILKNFPKSYIPKTDEFPDLDVIRVQDPEMVPPLAFDLSSYDYSASTVLGCGMILLGEKCFKVDHVSNQTIIQHFGSNTEFILSIPWFSETPDNPRDAQARYAYEIDLNGKAGSVDQPLLKIVKTPAVQFSIAEKFLSPPPYGSNKDTSFLLSIFDLYETDNINDIPNQGCPIIPSDRWRRVTSFPREPSLEETVGLALFDASIGMIPVVGDLVDVGEFFYGAFSGRDKWGRKVTASDLVLMGIGCLLPFVGSSALRSGKNLAKVFKGKAGQTAEVIDELRNANLGGKELETIHKAEKAILKGEKLSQQMLDDSAKVLQKIKTEPKIIDDFLNAGQTGFTHAELQEMYQSYRYSMIKKGETPTSPESWAFRQTKGRARDLLESLLGKNYAKGIGAGRSHRAINLLDIPRPKNYSQELVEEQIQYILKNHSEKVTERLKDALRAETNEFAIMGQLRQRINPGYFRIMKGNIAEIFSIKTQKAVLQEIAGKIAGKYPDANIISGIQMKVMESSGLSKSMLFTDNIIAVHYKGNLYIRGVFEVKSGFKGGQEATSQIFKWIEDKVVDGSELVIPKGSKLLNTKGEEFLTSKIQTFQYRPGSSEPGQVIGLMNADRHIITAKGVSHLGIDSAMQVATEVKRHELEITSEQLDYLTGQLLSRISLLPGG